MARMQVTHHYDADVETVYRLISEPAFIERKYTAQGATEITIESVDTDGAIRNEIRRKVTIDLPGFAKKVMSPTNTMVQNEQWSPPDADGRRVCAYTVEIQGVPSRIKGTVTLAPDAGGTSQDIEADVKVSIPLLGGKLEKFAIETGKADLGQQVDFTIAELAG
jgi:uncharacterized protein YndB with AHSA1/START domain